MDVKSEVILSIINTSIPPVRKRGRPKKVSLDPEPKNLPPKGPMVQINTAAQYLSFN